LRGVVLIMHQIKLLTGDEKWLWANTTAYCLFKKKDG
jgi:hypothetical protein